MSLLHSVRSTVRRRPPSVRVDLPRRMLVALSLAGAAVSLVVGSFLVGGASATLLGRATTAAALLGTLALVHLVAIALPLGVVYGLFRLGEWLYGE